MLEDYGQRGNPDWELAAPRWREAPERVRRMADAVARSEAGPRLRFAQQQRLREEAERRCSEDLRADRWLRPWRGALPREPGHCQRYSPLRETTQAACFLWVELSRRALLEAGRRTGAGDLLLHPSLEELRRLLDGPGDGDAIERARERRRLRAARTLYVPHVVDPTRSTSSGALRSSVGTSRRSAARSPRSEPLATARASSRASTRPRTASRGRSWWPPAPTPRGPGCLVAGGLVLEQGGMPSHGAVVAREYGLPAWVDVPHATRLIRNGQRIALDATHGCVSIEDA